MHSKSSAWSRGNLIVNRQRVNNIRVRRLLLICWLLLALAVFLPAIISSQDTGDTATSGMDE